MENGGRTMPILPAMEWVMCSTCSGFVSRKERRAAIPKPDEEVEEVVTEAEKMRDLMKAVLLHGPLQMLEPAQATQKQWLVLLRRRSILMETKKCPTCSGSLLDGMERKKIATAYEAMVADARSEQKLKQSREEGKRSSSGLKEKKKAESEDEEGSGSEKKKAKISSEMEGSGLKGEATIEDIFKSDFVDRKTKIEIWRLLKKCNKLLDESPVESQLEEEAKMEDSELAIGNRKTKMVTERLDKKSLDIFKQQYPPLPLVSQRLIDMFAACDEVDRVFVEYLECHSSIKGYADVQVEITDDEGDDHKMA